MCRIDGCPNQSTREIPSVSRSSQLEEATSTLRQFYYCKLANETWVPQRRHRGKRQRFFCNNHTVDQKSEWSPRAITHPDWMLTLNLGPAARVIRQEIDNDLAELAAGTVTVYDLLDKHGLTTIRRNYNIARSEAEAHRAHYPAEFIAAVKQLIKTSHIIVEEGVNVDDINKDEYIYLLLDTRYTRCITGELVRHALNTNFYLFAYCNSVI